MSEMPSTSLITEYIKNKKRNEILDLIFEQAAWNWIQTNVGIWDENVPTSEQIGKAYIKPNWGYNWEFTSDYAYIRITYNTIKNEYLDVKEDNEIILTFKMFARYF